MADEQAGQRSMTKTVKERRFASLSQNPHDIAACTTTLSPLFNTVTPSSTISTIPIVSYPNTNGLIARRLWYVCKSASQIPAEVARVMASRGDWIFDRDGVRYASERDSFQHHGEIGVLC